MNAWVGRFGFLVLGWGLKWWVDQVQEGEQGGEAEPAAEASSRGRRRQSVPLPREELKMVLVVNEELKMGKGKIGAQCAHAAVGLVEKLNEAHDVLLRQWEMGGQPKICLKAPDTQSLRQLAAAAKDAGLPIYVVQDAGRTQVAPGSRTVLAIGPAGRSQIDAFTGHLRLL